MDGVRHPTAWGANLKDCVTGLMIPHTDRNGKKREGCKPTTAQGSLAFLCHCIALPELKEAQQPGRSRSLLRPLTFCLPSLHPYGVYPIALQQPKSYPEDGS